jgi:hypothetical protein
MKLCCSQINLADNNHVLIPIYQLWIHSVMLMKVKIIVVTFIFGVAGKVECGSDLISLIAFMTAVSFILNDASL